MLYSLSMNSFLSSDIKLRYSISNSIQPTTDNILTNNMLLNFNCFTNTSIDPIFFRKNILHDDPFLNQIEKYITYVKSCSLFIDNYLKSLSSAEFIEIYSPSFGSSNLYMKMLMICVANHIFSIYKLERRA